MTLSIINKIRLSFGIVVILSLGFIVYAFGQISSVEDLFGDYRSVARESLILANLTEDMSEARLNALRYRTTGSEEAAAEVRANIEEILSTRERIDALVTDAARRDQLAGLEAKAIEYKTVFEQTLGLQGQRNELVAQMHVLGPDLRGYLSDIMETAYRDRDPTAAYYAGRTQEAFMLARYYAERFLLENDPASLDRAGEELQEARAQVTTLLAELQNPERRRLALAFGDGVNDFEGMLNQIAGLIQQRNGLYAEGLDAIGPAVLDGYDELFEVVESTQNRVGPLASATLSETSSRSLILGVVIALASAAIAVAIGIELKRKFSRSLGQMERLADGDLDFEIEGKEASDEFGSISRALEVFRSHAQEARRLEEQQKAAEEELAEQRRQEMAALADTFEKNVGGVINRVQDAANNLQSATSDITSAVDDTNRQSAEVATSSQETSQNVQTVAVASEQLDLSIKEISRNITDTGDATKDCVATANEARRQIDELSESVEKIEAIITGIKSVAGQTTMLALNANIEAARAGEAGKGFAVVASEVRDLANQTHRMTEEITDKVMEVQENANQTIDSVVRIIDQISVVDEKTTDVASAVEQQNTSTQEITMNAQHVAVGTEQVASNILGVKRAAEITTETTRHMNTAADDLSAQAVCLRQSVDAFLLEVRAG